MNTLLCTGCKRDHVRTKLVLPALSYQTAELVSFIGSQLFGRRIHLGV
jgi:hypothetical protein